MLIRSLPALSPSPLRLCNLCRGFPARSILVRWLSQLLMNFAFDAQTLLIALFTGIIGPCVVAFLNHYLEGRRGTTVVKPQKSSRCAENSAIWLLSGYLVYGACRYIYNFFFAFKGPADLWVVWSIQILIPYAAILLGMLFLRRRPRLSLFLLVPALLYEIANALFTITQRASFWAGVHIVLCASGLTLLFRAVYSGEPKKA